MRVDVLHLFGSKVSVLQAGEDGAFQAQALGIRRGDVVRITGCPVT